MFKKINMLLLAFSVLSSLVSFDVLAQGQVLKMATVAPEGTTWVREMRVGAEAVAKETQNRVTFKFYAGGVMGNDQAVLRKIKLGQLHGGAVTSGALTDVYDGAALYSVPFQMRNMQEITQIRKTLDVKIEAGLLKQGFVTLGTSDGGFAYLFSQHPVRSKADLAGRKVWAPQGDEIARAVLEKVGVTPVLLPISDAYTALQTGLADTIIATPTGMIAFQWHTRVKYFINDPVAFTAGMIVLDQRVFNKLSATDQAIVKKHMSAAFQRLNKINSAEDANALAALAKNGIVTINPDQEVRNHWYHAADTVLADFSARGLLNAALYNDMRKTLNNFRKQ
ncbi:MAG: TRAP transporter substrate-binding protein DctP [Gammaproteobacteria bacterium]|nr:TRAP transporter substrate-binding protein DctP [Gammaproteobacteria bacterium]